MVDAVGSEIDCESEDFPGQDGFYQVGCVSDGRFDDHGDGTVTDICTGLMWQKQTAPGIYSWQDGLKYCEKLGLADHDDWRLLNVRELISILDYGRLNPSVDPVFDMPDPSRFYWYWSSSTAQDIPDLAWIVGFWVGLAKGWYKTDTYHIRAVRSGP
jgi:hypothetical protein